MKWIKWYSITCICIFALITFFMLIFPNKVKMLDASSAYSLIEKKCQMVLAIKDTRRIKLMVLLQFIIIIIIQLM